MFSKQALLGAIAASLALSAHGFQLVADVIAHDLTPSVQGLELGTTGRADGTLTAVVFNPAGRAGAPWSQQANTIVLTNGGGGIQVTPGGTATVPSGAPVQLNPGAGTQGVTIQNGALAFQGGAWMACPNSVLQTPGFADDAVILSFKSAGQRTLFGCADVNIRQA